MADLLTLTQVAVDLGVSRQRVSQLADSKALKTIKILGRRAVRAKDFEVFKQVERPNGRPKKNGKTNR